MSNLWKGQQRMPAKQLMLLAGLACLLWREVVWESLSRLLVGGQSR